MPISATMIPTCVSDAKHNADLMSVWTCPAMLAKMAVVDTALNVEANLSLIKTPVINQELAAAALVLKNSAK